MIHPKRTCVWLATVFLAACASSGGGLSERELATRGDAANGAAANGPGGGGKSWGGGDVLYARDGTPVDADAQQGSALPAHDVAGGEGTRMYILELYQKVIEERDALTLEVASLHGEVDRGQQALATAEKRIAELEARCAATETERDGLRNENVDLAGRLTTAQIRRLQAEKLLLELRIAQQRALASTSAVDEREDVRKP